MSEFTIEQIAAEVEFVPVCSFTDCRAVRYHDEWIMDLPYNPKEINYTHSICPACNKKHYGEFQ